VSSSSSSSFPSDAGGTPHEDIDSVLASATDADRFPVLAAALASPIGTELRRELVRLVAPQLHLRAPRRYVRVLCRLEGAGYDEPVMLTDISATGVRFLVSTAVPLDLTHFGNMRLHAKTAAGPCAFGVALVRWCGGDDRYTDIACRFLSVEPDHAELVAEIRSSIFGAGASPATTTP
jgi:PilZ domain